MSNKIGRFEILSELAVSATGSVYKATDVESGQTVALKTLRLELLGEQAAMLVKQILEEAESSKVLNSQNVALLYGAGEIDGQFCASMEYVQGNSIATTMARKEGFSIWDLLDIARQVCQGLDHARVHKVVHYTLEPAKIMVQWDGVVKILSLGVSAMGVLSAQASGKAPETLHYMSPEQLRGDPIDTRSNLFSLGAILYEMVTEKKAFEGEDADQVRQAILQSTPAPPHHVSPKAQTALSAVIMKALSKAPEDRYASAQQLVDDLEKCKDARAKSATPAKADGKGVSPSAPVPAAISPKPSLEGVPANSEQEAVPKPMVRAAAAGASASGVSVMGASSRSIAKSAAQSSISGVEQQPAVKMSSSATAEPEVKQPRRVDPLVDETPKDPGKNGQSFSEISELPPLKEVYIPPTLAPTPPADDDPEPMDKARAAVFRSAAPEKPKVQPKEVAKKAVAEIKKTPPKLFGYAIAAALAVMLLVIGGIVYHVHSENSEEDAGPAQPAGQPRSAQVSSRPSNASPAAAPPAQTAEAAEAASPIATDDPSSVAVQPRYKSSSKSKKKGKAAPAPVAAAVIPGQLTVNTAPQGAQVTVDGQSDPGWTTPYNMTGLAPGQHTVVVSKSGYAPETRNVDVTAGSKSSLVVPLVQLAANVSLASTPEGAAVLMDGKDTGRVTPLQLTVDKPGNHVFLFKKQGYLDETATANLQPGQNIHLSPALKQLGATDDIRMGGKFKKLFGGSDLAGMGTVIVKTQPKGAQIAINNRMLDKSSPAEFYLNPGTYVVNITLSGYKSVEKIINVEKGAKLPVDETLERE
jgi:serine/threonine protein kinase